MNHSSDLRILYLEDYSEMLEIWLKFIRDKWGEQSRGARSREKAMEIIEEWEAQGAQPDFVILDRSILEFEADEFENKEAGNALYQHLKMLEIPVAVFSSGCDELRNEEPFFSDPPELGYYPKFEMETHLEEVVENFKKGRKAK